MWCGQLMLVSVCSCSAGLWRLEPPAARDVIRAGESDATWRQARPTRSRPICRCWSWRTFPEDQTGRTDLAQVASRRNRRGTSAADAQRIHRDPDAIRHFWGPELLYAPTDPEQAPRHVGTLEPLWNLFDLAPEGHPNSWYVN